MLGDTTIQVERPGLVTYINGIAVVGPSTFLTVVGTLLPMTAQEVQDNEGGQFTTARWKLYTFEGTLNTVEVDDGVRPDLVTLAGVLEGGRVDGLDNFRTAFGMSLAHFKYFITKPEQPRL